MLIHWAGEGSQVIMALTKDPGGNTSNVYISKDYGVTFTEIQQSHMMINSTTPAILDTFYNSPVYNSHVSLRVIQICFLLGEYMYCFLVFSMFSLMWYTITPL